MNGMKRISLSQSPTASFLLAHISCSVKKKKWKAISSNSMLILFALFRHLFPNQTTLNAPLCLLITFGSLFPINFYLSYNIIIKYFMPKNINSITINITLEGTEKIKTEKNDNKTVWRIYFSPALWENVNKLWNGFSILIGCLDRTIFDSHFLLVYFSGLKYILARQILHFSPQNAPQCPTKW